MSILTKLARHPLIAPIMVAGTIFAAHPITKAHAYPRNDGRILGANCMTDRGEMNWTAVRGQFSQAFVFAGGYRYPATYVAGNGVASVVFSVDSIRFILAVNSRDGSARWAMNDAGVVTKGPAQCVVKVVG